MNKLSNQSPNLTKQILVVEDDSGLRSLIVRILMNEGYKPIGLSSGSDAIEHITNNQDLVMLIDHKLPDMPGVLVIKNLAALGIKVPFIFMTGQGDERLVVDVMRLGAEDYLVKDNNFIEILLSVVEKLFAKLETAAKLQISEEALRESEERFRLIAENTADVIIVLNMNLSVKYISPSVFKLRGYTVEEAMTHTMDQMVTPNSLIKIHNVLSEQLQLEEKKSADLNRTTLLELEIYHKDGGTIWTEQSASFIRDEFNKPSGILSVIRDISKRKQTEIALMKSEEKYRALVDNSFEGILILTLEGNVLFANRALVKMLEYEMEDELIGRNVFEFLAPESMPKAIEDFQNVMSGIDSYVSEYAGYTSKGNKIFIESIGKVINYNGMTADLLSLRDITSRKKVEEALRESEFKYRALIESSNDVIFCVDKNGYYQFVNQVFASTFGQTPDYFYGKSFWDIYPKEHADHRFEASSKVFETGESGSVEVVVPLPDKTLYYLAKTNPILDDQGNVILNLTHATDITDRKRAEEELKESENRLRELNTTKDKFFSIIAHDLKNPLGNFRQIAKLLYDQYDSFNEDERKDLLQEIKDSSKNVYELLENLLEWSRSQRGLIELNPENIDLNIIARNSRELLIKFAENKNIVIENKIPVDTYIMADPNLITTVFRNLISNAIKFTNEGGYIEIGTIDQNNTDNQKSDLIVYIKDNGIGMAKKVIDMLFRLDQNLTTVGTSGEQGTGLGLILCKEFIEKHKGRIWVESDLEKGSVFYFALPK